MTDYSLIGFDAIAEQSPYVEDEYEGSGTLGPAPAQGSRTGHSTGWTAPTLIWERMKEIDIAATSLDIQIKARVKRKTFLDQWEAWFKHWKGLMDKYDSWSAKLAAATYSDDLAAQIEGDRKIFLEFEDGYRREGLLEPGGKENPGIPGLPKEPQPPPPPLDSLAKFKNMLQVPWWVFALGGVVLVGGIWLVKRRLEDPRMKEMMTRYGSPSQERLDSARAEVEGAARGYLAKGRDLDYGERYAYGSQGLASGTRMCPCPHQGGPSATYDPEQ